MTDACDLSALEARRLMIEKQLSPVELLESCIQRIESVDESVNAMVSNCYERAREEAKAAESAIREGEMLGPLHGLPLGVKDLNVTQDLRTTFGSLLFKDNVPEEDEGMIASLRRAGSIVLGKTNTPEFGAGANTTNKVFGPTRNPFDTQRTCGGSSGGSAVALATGMVPLCTGSDTGGSLRTPAAFCGVVSIRPTPGVVPSDRRAIGMSTYSVQGPMARTVADAALMLSAMAGSDAYDPLSGPLNAAALAQPESVDLSSLRVGISEDLGFAEIDQGIRKVFRERVAEFSHLFHDCAHEDPQMKQASEVFWFIRGVHFLTAHMEKYKQHPDLLGPNVLVNVEKGMQMKAEDIAWAYGECTNIYRRLQNYFEDIDVLICPTVAVPPFAVEQLYCDEINGRKLDSYIQWVDITAALTLTGHPVVQLPCGRDYTGTPFGLQIVGPRTHSERFVIGVAAALEAYFSTHTSLARPVPDLKTL